MLKDEVQGNNRRTKGSPRETFGTLFFQFHDQNTDVKWLSCLPHVTTVCESKGRISTIFFDNGE
jgi:hypothetical protein